MTAVYRYEVATRDYRGGWRVVSIRQRSFELEPRAVVHALMVRWVLDHWDPTLTGRIHVFGSRSAATEPSGLKTSIRIRVFRSDSSFANAPLAVAYLGDHEREWFGRRVVGWWSRAKHQRSSLQDRSGGTGEAA